MKLYNFRLSIVIVLIFSWLLLPVFSMAEVSGPGMDPLKLMNASPTAYEIYNGSPLYTGNINTVSPEGKKFAEEHSKIAEQTIQQIDRLGYSLKRTARLNQEYQDNLEKQLMLWRSFAKADPSYNKIFQRELQIYNLGFQLHLEELTRWSIIDSIQEQIEYIDRRDLKPVNESFLKSYFYDKLILNYIDLIEFYQKSYETLLFSATMVHSYQENPKLRVPANILNQIKPLHKTELETSELLLHDLDSNLELLAEINSNIDEIKDLDSKISLYSIKQIDNVVNSLETSLKKLKKDKSLLPIKSKNLLPLIESYIAFYKDLKKTLEEQKLSSEMKKAALNSIYGIKQEQYAFGGVLAGGKSVGQAGAEGLKDTAKIVSGTPYAWADYLTEKTAEKYYARQDLNRAREQFGNNSKNLQEWEKAFDANKNTALTANLKDTIVKPYQQGRIGQAGISKALSSYEHIEKDTLGGSTAAKIGLDIATLGQFSLQKGVSTLASDQTSMSDKAGAAVDVGLTLLPALKVGAPAVKGATEGGKSLAKNGSKVIAEVIADNATSKALDAERRQVLIEMGDITRKLGKATTKAEKDGLWKQMKNLAGRRDVLSQSVNDAEAKLFNDAVKNTADAGSKAIKDGASAAWNAAKDDMADDVGKAFKELYQDTVTDVAKQTLKDNNTLGNAASNLAGNFVDGATGELGGKIAGALVGDNKPPAQPNQPPANNTPPVQQPQNLVANNPPANPQANSPYGDLTDPTNPYSPLNPMNQRNNNNDLLNAPPAAINPSSINPIDEFIDPPINPPVPPTKVTKVPVTNLYDNVPPGSRVPPSFLNDPDNPNNPYDPNNPGGTGNLPPGAKVPPTFLNDPNNQNNAGNNVVPIAPDPDNPLTANNNNPNSGGWGVDTSDPNQTLPPYQPGNRVPPSFLPPNSGQGPYSLNNQPGGQNPYSLNNSGGGQNPYSLNNNPNGGGWGVDTSDPNQTLPPYQPGNRVPPSFLPPNSGQNPYSLNNSPGGQNPYSLNNSGGQGPFSLNNPYGNSGPYWNAPPGSRVPPSFTDPNLLNVYLGNKPPSGNSNPYNPNAFDDLINSQRGNQNTFNQDRGGNNNNNTNVVTNTPSNTFDTGFNNGSGSGNNSGNSLMDRVNTLSNQTGGWNRPRPPKPPANNPPTTQTPPSNIPVGDGIPETNRNDGIDNDNDGVIDEGPSTGNVQIAIHDTGGDKDDQWELKVDGSSIGVNNKGKTRFWDMNLSRGQHSISATGVNIPDNYGTYTIWFGSASVASGPSLTGRNLNQGTTFTWTINVP